MSDQKNLIIAIALSVAVMLGFNFFIEGPRQEKLRQQQAAEQTAQQAAAPAQPAAPGAAPVPNAAPGALPALPGQAVPAISRDQVMASTPRLTIDGKRVKGSINLTGGRFDDVELPDYRQHVEKDSPPIVLFSPAGAADAYYAEFGWIAGNGAKVKLPGADTRWAADRAVLKSGETATLTWDNGEGFVFTRKIQLDDNYLFTVTDGVQNKTGEAVTLFPYGLLSRHGIPHTDGLYILHEGPLGVFRDKAADEGKLTEFKYGDLKPNEPKLVDSIGGWLGFTDKYWLGALVPGTQQGFKARFTHTNNGPSPAGDRFQIDWLGEGVAVPANGTAQTANLLFAGAKETKLLNAYRDKQQIPRFDLAIDWGWFPFLTKPFFFLLDFFHGLMGGIPQGLGIAMLILTVIVKLVFFPLAYKANVAMTAMKKLQPEMTAMRERFANDREGLQREMMALYKREKVNPAAGCLPILLQIPVFFALYKTLYITIEMRHAPFFGWIHDLSAPDPTSWINLFGLLPYAVPNLGPLHILSIGIWPIIMGVTMFLQMRLNPQPPDPVQAKIFALMPIVFTFMLGSFASGLVIYWSWSNLLSILQQIVIMRRMGVKIGGGTDAPAKPAAPAKATKPGKSAK